MGPILTGTAVGRAGGGGGRGFCFLHDTIFYQPRTFQPKSTFATPTVVIAFWGPSFHSTTCYSCPQTVLLLTKAAIAVWRGQDCHWSSKILLLLLGAAIPLYSRSSQWQQSPILSESHSTLGGLHAVPMNWTELHPPSISIPRIFNPPLIFSSLPQVPSQGYNGEGETKHSALRPLEKKENDNVLNKCIISIKCLNIPNCFHLIETCDKIGYCSVFNARILFSRNCVKQLSPVLFSSLYNCCSNPSTVSCNYSVGNYLVCISLREKIILRSNIRYREIIRSLLTWC